MRARGFDDVTLDDVPDCWPVPRVGEAVSFAQPPLSAAREPVWQVLDVLYTFPTGCFLPVVVIKLHPEG
jgi:hypothetical protein